MIPDESARGVHFHPAAQREYLEARRWYEQTVDDELADSFLREMDAAIERVIQFPEAWPIFRDRYRWILLHRFPYQLFYRLEDDGEIHVLAVAHARRRPGYWLKRDE